MRLIAYKNFDNYLDKEGLIKNNIIFTKNILHLLNRSSKVHKIDILVYLKIIFQSG